MKLNTKATVQSLVGGVVAAFLITWWNEAGTLTQYSDLISFGFITKVVGTIVILSGMNTYYSHRSFRDSSSRTRSSDTTLESIMLDLDLSKKEKK